MSFSTELETRLSRKLTAKERKEYSLAPHSTWATAIAMTIVRKRAAGDMNAIKIIKDIGDDAPPSDTVITVQVSE